MIANADRHDIVLSPETRCQPRREQLGPLVLADAADRIGFTIAAGSLGRMLIAVSGSGLAAVMLGDSDAALEHALKRQFRGVTIERSDQLLVTWIEPVRSRLEGQPAQLELDVRGSAFQKNVWQILQRIPAGSTRTYGDVASSLGTPNAARAVARACAANPLAVVIPCHRVVGRGGMGGYRWGTDRKALLLERERHLA